MLLCVGAAAARRRLQSREAGASERYTPSAASESAGTGLESAGIGLVGGAPLQPPAPVGVGALEGSEVSAASPLPPAAAPYARPRSTALRPRSLRVMPPLAPPDESLAPLFPLVPPTPGDSSGGGGPPRAGRAPSSAVVIAIDDIVGRGLRAGSAALDDLAARGRRAASMVVDAFFPSPCASAGRSRCSPRRLRSRRGRPFPTR